MKKIKVLLCFALVMLGSSVYAQKTIVKGLLVDSLSNEGEPYATIRVFHEKDQNTPVAMSVTDLNGLFNQPVNGKGNFTIIFTSIGKETVARHFSLNGESILDLGTIYTKEDTQMLEGVEVVAQKPLVKMEVDKMSYNVEEDVDAKSNTILDMLRKVPMVTVDGQDNITVNGSGNFKVYVNGKPNAMMSSNPSMIFKNMPASMVKNIEVVTNPGAKYDAEGVGGVLNIILSNQTQNNQESLNGYNGSVRGMVGSKGYGGGAFISAQQGKLSVSANMMYNHQNIKNLNVVTERDQQSNIGNTVMESLWNGDNKVNYKMGDLNLSYEIDTVSSIGISASISDLDIKNNGKNTTKMNGGVYGNGFSYSNVSNTDQEHTSFNGSIDYQRFLGSKDRSITLSYMYTSTPTTNENHTLFENNPLSEYLDLTDRYTYGKNKTQEHVGQIDFTTPIAKGQKLNLGSKFTGHNASSKSDYYFDNNGQQIFSTDFSLNYRDRDNILAGYAEYEGLFGKVSMKGGMRYEHTWKDVEYIFGNGENFEKNYGNLVPSASLSYAMSPMKNIGLTYNMRISRPGISYLNPYIDRSNPTSISYGNTDLDVEKAHNVGLVFNSFSGKFMMNLSFHQRFCNNAIESYSFYQDNLLNTTYGNIAKNRQSSIEGYVNWLLAKKTRLFFNGGFSYVDLRSNILDARNNGWQGNMVLGIQQTLPGNIQLSLNTINYSKTYTLQGWNSGFNIAAGSLTKSFLKEKLNVTLSAVTPMAAKLNIKNYSRGNDFENLQHIKVPIRQIMLNVSYNFGNAKHQTRARKSNITNDYMEKKSDAETINSISGN